MADIDGSEDDDALSGTNQSDTIMGNGGDDRISSGNGDDVVWTKRVMSMSPDSATLEGGYTHVLNGDVLNIENRYRAKRRE